MARKVPAVLLVESAQDDRAMYAEYLRLNASTGVGRLKDSPTSGNRVGLGPLGLRVGHKSVTRRSQKVGFWLRGRQPAVGAAVEWGCMTTSAQHVIAVSGLVSGRADRLEPSSSISHNTDPASQ